MPRPAALVPQGSATGPAAVVPWRRWRTAQWLRRVRALLQARRMSALLGGVLAVWGLGSAGYIHAKAALAQVLLRDAWDRAQAGHAMPRPWPWADTWPVARLRVPRLAVDQIVLAGASGRTLAFGPALSPAGAAIGTEGAAVLSGHRDTHFAFLRELVTGDRLWLDTPQGRVAYAVEHAMIVDARRARLATGGEGARLVLVTCWPFDAVEPRGPWRYVVEARLAGSAAAGTGPNYLE
ncbi:MAG TPA: class GN sortase [Pseudomonadota bacterium]|nr:class GN sortase [Pseudomonadota bacterium]